jgi:hypothetical protein
VGATPAQWTHAGCKASRVISAKEVAVQWRKPIADRDSGIRVELTLIYPPFRTLANLETKSRLTGRRDQGRFSFGAKLAASCRTFRGAKEAAHVPRVPESVWPFPLWRNRGTRASLSRFSSVQSTTAGPLRHHGFNPPPVGVRRRGSRRQSRLTPWPDAHADIINSPQTPRQGLRRQQRN